MLLLGLMKTMNNPTKVRLPAQPENEQLYQPGKTADQ
jgi:hypothetical protein